MGKNLNLTKSLPFHLFWLQNINLLTKLTDILYWPCVYKTEHSTQTSRRLSFYRKWCDGVMLNCTLYQNFKKSVLITNYGEFAGFCKYKRLK